MVPLTDPIDEETRRRVLREFIEGLTDMDTYTINGAMEAVHPTQSADAARAALKRLAGCE